METETSTVMGEVLGVPTPFNIQAERAEAMAGNLLQSADYPSAEIIERIIRETLRGDH